MLASLRSLRDAAAVRGEIHTPLPSEGHILFGPGHFTPARDHTYSAKPDATGLHKRLTGKRRARPCDCRIRRGTLFLCEPCSRFGLDHLPLYGAIDDTPDGKPTDRADRDGRTKAAVGVNSGLKGGTGG